MDLILLKVQRFKIVKDIHLWIPQLDRCVCTLQSYISDRYTKPKKVKKKYLLEIISSTDLKFIANLINKNENNFLTVLSAFSSRLTSVNRYTVFSYHQLNENRKPTFMEQVIWWSLAPLRG